jgi:Domain of unknown function (DUF1905)/Bacteriocin-protection, YdeI or OmpD-Associated
MVQFKVMLEKFGEKGEKSGWTYFTIPSHIANELNRGIKTSYRVKGKIDDFAIKMVALVPMGEGEFIIAFNQNFQKGTGKKEGASIEVSLELDLDEFTLSDDLLACLADEPKAIIAFERMPKSHKKYYSNWVESAKTFETKSKRITQCVFGLANGMDYSQMIRHFAAIAKMK